MDARRGADVLFGQYTYRGRPVYGFHVTRRGAPLDTFARNVYVDTYDSAYGSGWHRESGFLSQNPTGIFCYALGPSHRKGHALPGDGVGAGSDPDRLVGRPRRGRRGGRGSPAVLAQAARLLWLIEFALWATSEH